MPTPTPVFPLDIFELIVNIVAEGRSTEDKLTPTSAACLRDLSLVCRDFADLSRRHLFRCIRSKGSSGVKVLGRLLGVVHHAPNARIYVQDLKIDFDNYNHGPIPDATLACARIHLARFPNLQALSLSYNGFDPSSRSWTPDNMNPVISLLHHLMDYYITQGTLRSLAVDSVPHLSTSTIANFMAGISSKRFLSTRTGMNGVALCSQSRITTLVLREVPSFELSILSYLPELTSLELSVGKTTLDTNCTMDTLSLHLVHLFLSFSEPGQAAIVVNLYKQCAASSGFTAFGKLLSLNYGFIDQSDVLAFNKILMDVPPLRSLFLFAQQYNEPVFPFDIINLDDYLQYPSRPLKSLYIGHRTVPTTEANFRATISGLHNFLSSLATRNVLEYFFYHYFADADRLSLPPSGPWHDIGDILAPVTNFPNLTVVDVTLVFDVNTETLALFKQEEPYPDNFYIEGAMMDLGDRLGEAFKTSMSFVVPRENS